MIDFTLPEILTGLDLSEEPEKPAPLIGGFPWGCYDHICISPATCILKGCAKGNTSPAFFDSESKITSNDGILANWTSEAEKPE
jgi:hypothetical protein